MPRRDAAEPPLDECTGCGGLSVKTYYVVDEGNLTVHFHFNSARRKRIRALLGLVEIRPLPLPQENRHADFRRCSWGSYDPEVCAFLGEEEALKVVERLSPHGGSGLIVVDRERLFDMLDLEDAYWPQLATLPEPSSAKRARDKVRRDQAKARKDAERAQQSLALQAMRLASRPHATPSIAV